MGSSGNESRGPWTDEGKHMYMTPARSEASVTIEREKNAQTANLGNQSKDPSKQQPLF